MIKVLSFLSDENCFAGHGLSTTGILLPASLKK